MVDDLAEDYASLPVVFLEHPADGSIGGRSSRWWATHPGGGGVTLPLVMVDSGHGASNGYVSFYNVYKGLVDAELSRAPGGDVQALAYRSGNRVRVAGQFQNRSGGPLSNTRNAANIQALIYEEARVGLTGRYVRAAPSVSISPELPDLGVQAFALETGDLTGVDWTKLHVVVFADYRPGGATGPYDMLQAAIVPGAGSTTPTFSDSPLQPKVTPVRLKHIAELRAAIAELRARHSLYVFQWTDAALTAGVTPVKGTHVMELRGALNDVYTALSRPLPSYTNNPIVARTTVVTTAHIAQLRSAVLAVW